MQTNFSGNRDSFSINAYSQTKMKLIVIKTQASKFSSALSKKWHLKCLLRISQDLCSDIIWHTFTILSFHNSIQYFSSIFDTHFEITFLFRQTQYSYFISVSPNFSFPLIPSSFFNSSQYCRGR